jgi:hypothetical protein
MAVVSLSLLGRVLSMKCPDYHNPADFFIQCLAVRPEAPKEESIRRLEAITRCDVKTLLDCRHVFFFMFLTILGLLMPRIIL